MISWEIIVLSTNNTPNWPILTCVDPKCLLLSRPLFPATLHFRSANGRISGMWQGLNLGRMIGLSFAPSQAALSSPGFGRIKRWWMPPPIVWTTLRWPQQKAGKAGKKARLWFTDRAGDSRGEDECHSAPAADSHSCKEVLPLHFLLQDAACRNYMQ